MYQINPQTLISDFGILKLETDIQNSQMKNSTSKSSIWFEKSNRPQL